MRLSFKRPNLSKRNARVWKVLVGPRFPSEEIMSQINAIASHLGAMRSTDQAESNWPKSETYLFSGKKSRKQFIKVLKGRFGDTVTIMER